MATTDIEVYRLSLNWTPYTNLPNSQLVSELFNARALESFTFNIRDNFPNELAAQIFNALETKTHLNSLSIIDNFPDDNADGQPGFSDYFYNFLLARGSQLEKLKFRNTKLKIELVERLIDIATASMTSLRTLSLNRMVETTYISLLTSPILKLYSSWISKSNLTELRIIDSLLSSNDIGILADGLSQNNSITKLNLSKNKIGDTGVLSLATALESNSSITWLDLSSNKIGDDGISLLAFLLKKNNVLKRLDLTGNMITYKGVRQLGIVLKSNKGLAELYLDTPPHHIDKGADALSSFMKWCQFNSSLKHLALNDFQVDDSAPLLTFIEKNTSITSLELARTKTIDLSALAKVLRNNKTLLAMNLSGILTDKNMATDVCTEFFQAVGLSNLTRVNLSHNHLEDHCINLAEALMHNNRLQSLNLSNNRISWHGTKALANYLAVNTSLLELDLSLNANLSEELFTSLLQQNQTLTALNIYSSPVTPTGCQILAEIIAKHNFHELDISNSYQIATAAPLLAVAMQRNRSLVKLRCDFHPYHSAMKTIVAAAPQLMHVLDQNANHKNTPQICIQRTWLARSRFKAQVSALRAAQVVLLAPDRGTLTCLPTEILELIFGAMAGHSSTANDFLVTFAKHRERLKYERELTNRVEFLRGYLKYLHCTITVD